MSQDSNMFEMTHRLEAQGKIDSSSDYKWDDGSDHDDVTKIYVSFGKECIRNIRFDYIKSGQTKIWIVPWSHFSRPPPNGIT